MLPINFKELIWTSGNHSNLGNKMQIRLVGMNSRLLLDLTMFLWSGDNQEKGVPQLEARLHVGV